MSRRRFGRNLLGVLGPLAAMIGPFVWLHPGTLAAAPPERPPAASVVTASPEGRLWAEIQALTRLPTSLPVEGFQDVRARRTTLLEKVRLYQTLYPGGSHLVPSVRLELATLHELAVLAGGDYAELCRRADAHAQRYPPDHPVRWEAEYWRLRCAAWQRAADTQPSSAGLLEPTPQDLADYRTYVQRYPRSPYVPRLVETLFANAWQKGNGEEMQRLVDLLDKQFPSHAVTETLKGKLARRQAVGELFWLAERQPDGSWLDTRTWLGAPVLIVTWSAFDLDSAALLAAVESFRQRHPDVRVVGVNLDPGREAMESLCRELGFDWPQLHDGLGPATSFARRWGLTESPCVLVIDRRGRLMGWAGSRDWQALAAEAVKPN